MSGAWASASIQKFEQVSLHNGTELFRVRARAPVGTDPDPRPVLVAGPPGDARSYEPLSSGGDRRGLLRLAYSVPTEQVGPSVRFGLQLPDGHRIDLPEPTPGESRDDVGTDRRAANAAGGPPGPASATPAQGHDESSARARHLEQELEALRSASEQALRSAQDTAARASTDLEVALGSLRSVEAERDTALGSLRSAEAERDTALGSLRSVEAERDTALHSADSTEAEREAARAGVESAQAQRDAALQDADAARGERDEALREADAARGQRDQALRDAEGARGERDDGLRDAEAARAERDDALHDADAARGERDAAVQAGRDAEQTVQAAQAERDAVLEATSESRAEHARLTSRLRQHEARFELLRADAQRSQSAVGGNGGVRMRRLEAEREQLTGHVRALAELLSISTGADRGRAALDESAERIAAMRDRAVRAAQEQAEHDLQRLLVDDSG